MISENPGIQVHGGILALHALVLSVGTAELR
jgi:hypothetical protein